MWSLSTRRLHRKRSTERRAPSVSTALRQGCSTSQLRSAPTALRSIGMSEEDLDLAADLSVSASYWSPREIERNAIRASLDDAFHGRHPPS
jgi:hypothetical protein